jgi:hypothetical protein
MEIAPRGEVGVRMGDRTWRCLAIDMRLWAAKVRDPYTRIEMMALADLYDQKADTLRKVPPAIPASSRPLAITAPM